MQQPARPIGRADPPGPDELAQPDHEDRPPDRRGTADPRGRHRRGGRKRALEVLEMVEMPRPAERLDQYPFELSGGLRQRVIIAMGLVCRPKLLIADEPTTALDVTIQAQILDIIDTLRDQLNMGVLLITHDMGVIAGRADRVVVMYAGTQGRRGRRPTSCSTTCATPTPRRCWRRCPTWRTPPSTSSARSRDCRRTSPRRSWAAASPRAAPTPPTSAGPRSPR